jgi:hypothetical protein
MKIIDIADKILEKDYKNREFDPGWSWPSRSYFYPSQTNLKVNGAVAGVCQRKLYYNMLGMPEPSFNAMTLHKFERGNFFEDWYQNILSRAHITDIDFQFIAGNVKFKDEENKISGEFDGIVKIDDKYIGLEIKTIGGNYQAIKNHCSDNSYPKDEAVFQVMQYLDYACRHPLKVITSENLRKINLAGQSSKDIDAKVISWKHKGFSIKNTTTETIWLTAPSKKVIPCSADDPDAITINEFRVIYWSGGEHQAEHTIALANDGHVIVNGKHYYDLNVKNIHESRKELIKYLDSRTLPPKEYRNNYDNRNKLMDKRKPLNQTIAGIKRRNSFKSEKHKDHARTMLEHTKTQRALDEIDKAIEDMYQKDIAAKFSFQETSRATWAKKDSDWQCLYCPYRKSCETDFNPE